MRHVIRIILASLIGLVWIGAQAAPQQGALNQLREGRVMNAIVGDGAYYLTSQSCGGEPICAQHDRVPLAIKARNLADSTLPTPAKASFSLCTSQETVVFSCGTGAKVVSVCASPGASRTGGYVQYRFGVPGAPEVTLPATRVSPSQASTGATETYSGGGSAWLRFQQGGYGYVVYAGIGRWGSRGETRDVAGVVVEQPRAANMNMKCVGKITSLLGPDWFGEMGIQRKTPDESFELPNP